MSAKPDTPPKVAKSGSGRQGAAASTPAAAVVAAAAAAESPLSAAFAQGEAVAAAAAAARPPTLAPVTNTFPQPATAGPAGVSIYSEGATKRLRETLRMKRSGLEGRLEALEKRSAHLESLTSSSHP